MVTVQVIPAGVLVIVPLPFPMPETVTVAGPKVAAAVVAPAAPIVTTQISDVAGHAAVGDPFTVQAVSVEPEFRVGVATKVTCCPGAKFAVHVLGHAIPPNSPATVPAPVTVTVSGTPEAVATPVPETE